MALYTVIAWRNLEKTERVITYTEEAQSGSIAMSEAVKLARLWNEDAQPRQLVRIVQVGERETRLDGGDGLPVLPLLKWTQE